MPDKLFANDFLVGSSPSGCNKPEAADQATDSSGSLRFYSIILLLETSLAVGSEKNFFTSQDGARGVEFQEMASRV
jgi:hypothetical protein